MAAITALLVTATQVASPAIQANAVDSLDAPVIAAHRGAAALCPESTMAGFQAVADEFPNVALEMDVQPLKDGALVVFHDDLIDRVAADGATGRVADMTTAQWQRLRIRHPAGGEPAPAAFLDDVLESFGGTGRPLLIELKNSNGRNAFIEKLWPYRDQVILQSFSDANTSVFIRSGFRAIQLMGSPRDVLPGVYATGLPITSITPGSVTQAHDVGAQAWLWGPDLRVNDVRAKDLDISGFIVNDPRT